MMDLHQTLYKFHELLIITGVHKSHLDGNLTDYRLKDCYLKSELNITFSNILLQTGNNDTGQ